MKCKYCESYHLSDKRITEMHGKTKVQQRYCTAIRKFVNGTDAPCEHFKFNHVFWCRKYEHWIQSKACINRQKEKYEKCHKCKQGKQINEMVKREFLNGKKIKRRKIAQEINKKIKKLRRRNEKTPHENT